MLTYVNPDHPYTFEKMWKHNPKMHMIDLIKLASDYRQRNRNLVWEFFYNYSRHLSKRGDELYLEAVTRDPVYGWTTFKREDSYFADMTHKNWERVWCPKSLLKSYLKYNCNRIHDEK